MTHYSRHSRRKAFTVIEMVIVIGLFVILGGLFFASTSNKNRHSVRLLEQLLTFGRGKRILKAVTAEIKGAQTIVHPDINAKKSSWLLIKKKDGTLRQLYFDNSGSFYEKSLPEGKDPRALVRLTSSKVSLKQAVFERSQENEIKVYLQYEITANGSTEPLVDVYDAVSLHK
jgi:type II secretory pathway pseudopilin PulG